VAKPKRIVCRPYREFISKLMCMVPGCEAGGLKAPHHWQFKGQGGTSTKVSDFQCVPLCNVHHIPGVHAGRETFMKRHGINEEMVRRAIAIYNREWEESNGRA